ncbi:EpsG family protein [Ramlibacter terrae]|uniref:EpsG family protein n=1 Tax=Ramlibacter terrae TaxID=2732511 RepID=A0ABX6P1Z2_9BURK|nr:EpsG family protein [Ramlibacter terrae]
MPYPVIVVAMGYSRQGIALGFAMLGLLALQKGSVTRFAIWVLIGATFHRSAVLLLPIAALTTTRNRFFVVLWIGVLSLVGYQALVERDMEDLYANYIQREYRSQGALIRLLMNGAAAGLFPVLRKRLQLAPARGCCGPGCRCCPCCCWASTSCSRAVPRPRTASACICCRCS